MDAYEPEVGPGDVVAWLVVLALGGLLLAWSGGGALATPSLLDPSAWQGWATSSDPLVVVASMLRLLALGLVWYLVGLSAVSLVARLLHAELLARGAATLAVGPAAVLVRRLVGASLAVGVLATSTTVSPLPTPPPPAIATGPATTDVGAAADDATGATAADDETGATAADDLGATAAADGGRVTDQRRAPDPPRTGGVVDGTAAPERPDVPRRPADPVPWVDTVAPGAADAPRAASRRASVGIEVRVRAGDHLWSIAADLLEAHHGAPQDDPTVAAYWVEVLAANAERLVVPNDPDLLVPGQVVLLPPVEGARP